MTSAVNDLLRRAQSGDREALGKLLAAHERSCYTLALRLTGSEADAQDVCQDAFTRITRSVRSSGEVSNVRSWLLSIVLCAHRDRLGSEVARRQRERSYGAMTSGSVAAAASSGIEQGELRRQLNASLGRLDEDYRVPIVLHHEQGLTYAETARVLGVPEGTVATNIRRGLEELKGMMTAAGYACTVPAVVGLLAEGLTVAVPTALTAFVQSLTVAAEGGAAAVGKAAAGAVFRISARLSAKKAAGLALGWKVGTVVTAVAIGGAAVVAVNSGMFEAERPAVPAAAAPEAVEPTGDPAGWWKFDEGQGDEVLDSSGNRNRGEIRGAEWTEGRIGSALRFRGAAFVTVGRNASLRITGHVTMAAWIRILGSASENANRPLFIVGQDGSKRNYALAVVGDESGQWRLQISHRWDQGQFDEYKESTTGVLLRAGEWYHVTAVITPADGGTHRYFVNGEPICEFRSLGFTRLGDNASGRWIGCGSSGAGFDGVIDDVRIYDRALSTEEVARLAGVRAGGAEREKAPD